MHITLISSLRLIAAPACAALIFGMPLSAAAGEGGYPPPEQQEPAGAPPPGAEQPAAAQGLDPQTKEQFVDAYVEIQQIQQEFSTKLEGAADEDQARDIQQQAQDEMIQAVQGSGMSVDKYNEVVAIISADPELRQEIEELAQARQ